MALNQESMTRDSNVFEIWTENYKFETFAKLSEIQMTTYGIIANWVDGSSKVGLGRVKCGQCGQLGSGFLEPS